MPWRVPSCPSGRGGGGGGGDGAVLAALPIQGQREAESVNATLTPLCSPATTMVPRHHQHCPPEEQSPGTGKGTSPRGDSQPCLAPLCGFCWDVFCLNQVQPTGFSLRSGTQ